MQFDRAQLRNLADGFAAAAAALLPWSTSGTLIAVGLWLVAVLPTLRADELRDVLRHPAAFLPVALFALAAVGMLWADVTWKERLSGLAPFARLLILPVLFVQFRQSDHWRWVFGAFLVSCTVLLAVSFAGILMGGSFIRPFKSYGVPVRDYIAQAGEFTLCAMALLYLAMHYWSQRRTLYLLAALVLAVLFLANVIFIAPSRTALVTIPLLLALLAVTQFRLSQTVALLAVLLFVCAAIWVSSTTVQQRLVAIYTEVQTHRVQNVETSAGLRVEFWRQSLNIIRTAPVLGHGTGSVRQMFEKAVAAERSGVVATVNPHNQTFMVAIQLGLAGALLLFAMWGAHCVLFVRGAGLVAWIGLAVVAQNIIGGLFNTHLFDFVQGWIYLLGVGVAGGAVLGQPRKAAAAAAMPRKAPA